MENNFINITDEELDNLSMDELADLKIELDDLQLRISELLKQCDDILNN